MAYPCALYKLDAYYGQMVTLFSDCSSGNPQVVAIGHSGSDGTYVWGWPEEDLIILYFTQSRGGSTGTKLEAVIDELLNHPELKEINEQARVLYSSFLGSYVANFGPFRNTEFIVTVQNGVLAVDIPKQLVFELDDPDEDGKRCFTDMPGVAVSFEEEGSEIKSMTLFQGGTSFVLPKGTATVEEKYPEDMEKYTGTYETEDPELTMKIVIVNERLALDIPGQPVPLELYPPDVQGIWVMRLNPSVSVSFTETTEGEVESVTLYVPGGVSYTRKRLGD